MDPRTVYDRYRDRLVQCLDSLDRETFAKVVRLIEDAYRNGRMIFIFGNGGSAATASHFECDLNKGPLGYRGDRPIKRFRVIALTDNIATITAWANDTSFNEVFAGQLRNLGRAGDLAIGISASGNSPNILRGIVTANEMGMTTIGFCGFDGGKLAEIADVALVVKTEKGEYGVVEDVHDILHHIITTFFIKKLNPSGESE